MITLLGIIVAILIFWSGAFVGYKWQKIAYKLGLFVGIVTDKVIKTKPEEQEQPPQATFIDPDDVQAVAKWEHDEMMRSLNGGK